MATANPLHDLVFDALDHAPEGEPLSREILADVEAAEADFAAGLIRGIPQNEIRAMT